MSFVQKDCILRGKFFFRISNEATALYRLRCNFLFGPPGKRVNGEVYCNLRVGALVQRSEKKV